MSARRVLLAFAIALALVCCAPSAGALAQGLEDDGSASWQLEQPAPPPPPPGVPEAPAPIGLGRVGDIEFAPGMSNRGALITSGNPPTIPAGVWEYNGVAWHELASVCGASDGRIVWAGPEEFWTISDGRPGQAANARGELPPTRDNTLCRFSNPGHAGEPLRVMESFAFPAFEADSYQAMNAGACFTPSDCWFAGNPLPRGSAQAGSFQLHWNGETLTEVPYPLEGYAVESMQRFEGRLYAGVRISEKDRVETGAEPVALHAINPAGTEPTFEAVTELPLYEPEEFPAALDFLHLSAGEELLWGAAGPQATPEGSQPGQLTVVRDAGGGWQQVLGPKHTASAGAEPFPGMTPTSIAAEPGTDQAWLGLDTPEDYDAAISELDEEPSASAFARVARVAADGTISAEDEQSLPSAESGIGPKGAAFTITCPGAHDCWMATTHGWLFHLATPQEQAEQADGADQDHDPAFETLISERPHDLGLPVETPDTLPPDDSGLGELPALAAKPEEISRPQEARVTLPLLSNVHSRLLDGHIFELRFHLAVKARMKLIARRKRQLVASTPMRTLAAGNRSLRLSLNPKRWPTKLQLESHALAPLPTTTLNKSNETTVTTSLRFPSTIAEKQSGLWP